MSEGSLPRCFTSCTLVIMLHLLSYAVLPVYIILCFCLIVSGGRPKLYELEFLEGVDGRGISVIRSVAQEWKFVAVALGFAIHRIRAIEGACQRSIEKACMEMFMSWLEGGPDLAQPITWDTLIMCLRHAALIDIADRLKIILMDKSGMCNCA